MFEGRKEELPISSPQYTKDRYNYPKVTYKDEGTARIYIVVQDRTKTVENDIELYSATLVGYTDNLDIDKGWKVGNYEVLSTMPHRRAQVLYLRGLSDGE